jgi:hypothetical protein
MHACALSGYREVESIDIGFGFRHKEKKLGCSLYFYQALLAEVSVLEDKY